MSRGDDGFVAVELALGIGLLLLPVAFVVLTIPSWSERQTTGRAIAREVGPRSRAKAGATPDWRTISLARWRRISRWIDRKSTSHSTAPTGDELAAGSELAVSVTVQMPAVHLPAVGTVGEWSWTARNHQPVDLYGSAR